MQDQPNLDDLFENRRLASIRIDQSDRDLYGNVQDFRDLPTDENMILVLKAMIDLKASYETYGQHCRLYDQACNASIELSKVL